MRADPRRFEFFDASTTDLPDELGLAWLNADGRIEAKTLSEYLPDEEVRAEFTQRLGFSRASDVFWPLPLDPSRESVAEWESGHGPLPAVLERYYRARTRLPTDAHYALVSVWTIAAAIRSPQMRFAPSILVRSPFGWGKSTVAEAIGNVTPRCVYGATITPAAVYRTVNEYAPAFVIDESALADNPELQRVVRTGFKKGAKIIRAKQNSDWGIRAMDPWAFLILTAPVDPADDIMSRCFPLDLLPGEPETAVRPDDREAVELRTVLTRLRLEHAAGITMADYGAVMDGVRRIPDIEPRTKDKLESLWPIGMMYGVTDTLITIAKEAEAVAEEQYGLTDRGLVVAALEALVTDRSELKAEDLEVSRVHERVKAILVSEGEGEEVPVRRSPDVVEIVRRLDRKYSVRDYTSKNLRLLGFRVKTVMGRARIDLESFKVLWPTVRRRYLGLHTSTPTIPTIPTIDTFSNGVAGAVGVENPTPTTPLRTVGISRDKSGGHGRPETAVEAQHPDFMRAFERARDVRRYDPKRPVKFIVGDLTKELEASGHKPDPDQLTAGAVKGMKNEEGS